MKHIHRILRNILFSLLIIRGVDLCADNNITFAYWNRDSITGKTKATILLKQPNDETIVLFDGTQKEYKFSEEEYFKLRGKYTVSILYEAENYGKDSCSYDFSLSGEEFDTDVLISFEYLESDYEGVINKKSKALNGYIRVYSYYRNPKSVKIELSKDVEICEFYKGPFFTITNNSTDTLYGEHLPGYFWGTLSYLKNDSIFRTRTGRIDYNFEMTPPLYPDSMTLATVGSFGLTNNLAPFEYRYEVKMTNKRRSQVMELYKEREAFVWWTEIMGYYRIKYDFKVEE